MLVISGVPEVADLSHYLLSIPSPNQDDPIAARAKIASLLKDIKSLSLVSVASSTNSQDRPTSPKAHSLEPESPRPPQTPKLFKLIEALRSFPAAELNDCIPTLCRLLLSDEPRGRRAVYKLLVRIMSGSAIARPEVISRYLQILKQFYKSPSALQSLLACAVEFWFFAGELSDEFIGVLVTIGAAALPQLTTILNHSYLITPS